MNKAQILHEIKRTAESNGGVALGRLKFENETGLKEWHWQKFWPRWSDAVREAGYAPNSFVSAYDDAELLDKLARLAKELGRIPVRGDLNVKATSEPGFPRDKTFRRFGGKADLIKRLGAFCKNHSEYQDVAQLCSEFVSPNQNAPELPTPQAEKIGFVYLAKTGRFYKIGKTNHVGRRGYELALQLPERPTTVHIIETDDPSGVENYWHRRFKDKRKGGEFFDLTPADVSAFKKWRKIV